MKLMRMLRKVNSERILYPLPPALLVLVMGFWILDNMNILGVFIPIFMAVVVYIAGVWRINIK